MKTLLFILFTISLNAHALHITTTKKGSNLSVKAFYDKTRACNNCIIEIIKSNNVYMSKKADKNGISKFDTSSLKKEFYTIVAKNPAGHREEINFNLK